MNEALAHLDAAILIVTTVLSLLCLKTTKEISSVMILSFAFLFIQCLSVVVTRPIISVLTQVWPEGASMVFYFGFAFVDMAIIYVIAAVHEQLQVKPDRLTYFVVVIYCCFIAMQIARYFDRLAELNFLSDFYQYAIPALNLLMLCSLSVGFVLWYKNQKMDDKARMRL